MLIAVKKLLYSPLFNRSLGVILAFCWVIFAWLHLRAFFATGLYAYLVFIASETLQALFFVIRSNPKTVTNDPFAWAAAFAGTFAVLNLRPTGIVFWSGGSSLIVLGFSLQIFALLSLNTSFAIVPANRGVKTNFGYRIVRHPIYFTYMISFIGYLLINATALNAVLIVFFIALTIVRIHEEEKHLKEDQTYRAYMQKVRYRLMPYIY